MGGVSDSYGAMFLLGWEDAAVTMAFREMLRREASGIFRVIGLNNEACDKL